MLLSFIDCGYVLLVVMNNQNLGRLDESESYYKKAYDMRRDEKVLTIDPMQF
jgi:hypothetical protein